MKTLFRFLGLLALVLLAWHLVADRLTPHTSNARVKAVVTRIVPQVSGQVTEVLVSNGQGVVAGDVLARIDPRSYQIAVARAEADLEAATQEIGASSAQVASAQAKVARATSDLENTKLQTARIFEMERKGLVAAARGDDGRAQLSEAESRFAEAQAELQRAQQQLGPEGKDNPAIRAALAQLADAKLNLEWTELRAPAVGGVSNLDIATGAMAAAGQPIMTFIDAEDVWIEAYMTENNIGRIEPGQRAEVTLDVHPGRILEGRVESLSGAASIGSDTSDGLSAPPRISGWMRDPQRFPVRIVLPGYERGSAEDDVLYQLNGQAVVTVYTGDNALLNSLAAGYIRLMAWLSYAY